MSSKRIVVLGGTGFVGRHLISRLCAEGHQLTVLSRNLDAHLVRFLPPGSQRLSCDVYDGAALARAFTGADVVINLVGILNESGNSGQGFRRAHSELTYLVTSACREAGVKRLLHMSALNAGRGQSHYLHTRGEAETVIKASHLDWTIFQPSVIFGPDDGLLTRFRELLRLAPVLPLARAECKFAPVYIKDVVEAFVRALDNPATVRQVYELYGPEVISLKKLVRRIAQVMGWKRLVLPLPDSLGWVQAMLAEWIPGKPFSRDNFRSLATDSVGGIDGLHRLGITPTPLSSRIERLLGSADSRQKRLDRYRRQLQ
ncbi:MAG: epimerase [Gammaproteobacteria bacterium HGW-Gammaproteobacteria-5]|nr:MAG: epimerase [Gammaproteobacteria bacterium HGW-Gammaproteobacteria-5]